jgi:uncharacterized protein with HEPN domain
VQDVLTAIDKVAAFTAGCDAWRYRADEMLQSAVERPLEVVGEALAQLARRDPETAGRISERARIVAFRTVLVHGYASVDPRIVWDIVTAKLATLRREAAGLLEEMETHGELAGRFVLAVREMRTRAPYRRPPVTGDRWIVAARFRAVATAIGGACDSAGPPTPAATAEDGRARVQARAPHHVQVALARLVRRYPEPGQGQPDVEEQRRLEARELAVPAPRVLAGIADEAGADRVEVDVGHGAIERRLAAE